MSKAIALAKAINSLLPVLEEERALPVLAKCLNDLTQISLHGDLMRSPVVQPQQPATPISITEFSQEKPVAKNFPRPSSKVPLAPEIFDALEKLRVTHKTTAFIKANNIGINTLKVALQTKMATPELQARLTTLLLNPAEPEAEPEESFPNDKAFMAIAQSESESFTQELQQ